MSAFQKSLAWFKRQHPLRRAGIGLLLLPVFILALLGYVLFSIGDMVASEFLELLEDEEK